jgi:outer membrane protein OmpA-like peptidoglycan-associated protein
VNGAKAAGPKTLTKIAKRDLGKLTPVIASYSSYHIEVQGYADSTAKLEKGDALADARSQVVREALIAGGLDAGRIETKAMGHASPVSTNATIVGRRANRRVEIVVVGSGAP